MSRRPARSDHLVDRPKLLDALGRCRNAIIEQMSRMKIGGPIYYSASTVIAAIDGLALMLTGERGYFHLKGHGGPPGDRG